MEFEILAGMPIDTFHALELQERSGYFLLPLIPLKADSRLFVKDFEPTSHLNTNFNIGGVGLGAYNSGSEDLVALLFYSRLPVYNYSTSLLSYSMSWQKSVANISIGEDQTSLVYKSDLFYMYEVPTIATLVTCGDLSSKLNSYLTMV